MNALLKSMLSVSCAVLFLSTATLPQPQELKPSRDNFFREILYAKASSVTPLYDDYTNGSYHVDKLDVLKGLPEMAAKEGLKLRGLIVVGPVDVLWTYYIIAFLDEEQKIRVNSLIMPHARITYKSTGTIDRRKYSALVDDLLKVNVLKPDLPPKGECETCPYPEWHFDVLFADWSNGQARVYYADVFPKDNDSFEKLQKPINDLLSGLNKTYPVAARRR